MGEVLKEKLLDWMNENRPKSRKIKEKDVALLSCKESESDVVALFEYDAWIFYLMYVKGRRYIDIYQYQEEAEGKVYI